MLSATAAAAAFFPQHTKRSGAPAVPDRDTAILAGLDAIQRQDESEDAR